MCKLYQNEWQDEPIPRFCIGVSRPNQPAQSPPDLTRTNTPVSQFRVSATQDLMPVGQVTGFLLQNSSYPTQRMLYTNPANSNKIKLKSKEIYLDHIWWDLARSD